MPNNQVLNPQGGVGSNQINYLQLGDTVSHNDTEYGWFTAEIKRPSVLTQSGREGDWYPQQAYIKEP